MKTSLDSLQALSPLICWVDTENPAENTKAQRVILAQNGRNLDP